MIHYEVENELNPKYTETGYASDYYGLYHVVKFDGDTRLEVIRTFGGGFTSDRSEAYKLAGRLTDKEPLITVLSKMENAVNRSVSGIKVDLGEWLQLISEARRVLGNRVIE